MHHLSHTGQDAWVAHVLKFKRNGYFLDFGGFEGLMHSNTFYLEKFLGWQGILVEPNPRPYMSACAVRSCVTINAALYPESRKSLEFTDSHGLSSLTEFQDCDSNKDTRMEVSKGIITVDTINPTELLNRFNAPNYIDYLSLDIEGAEFLAIKSIDLEKYRIALMTIEHNHEHDKQSAIREYLGGYGYGVIEHWNDDFFYNKEHLEIVANGEWNDPVKVQDMVHKGYRMVSY